MRLRVTIAFAAAIAFSTILNNVASAAPLSKEDEVFVVAAISVTMVLTDCPKYDTVENGLTSYGDLNGVSPEIGPAIGTAVHMMAKRDYDRSLLIPEVTRKIYEVMASLLNEKKRNREKFCQYWGDLLVQKGIMKKAE